MDNTSPVKSPFVRVYYRADKNAALVELSEPIKSFRYVFDESGIDLMETVFEVLDRSAADLPYFQEKAELEIVWGFIKGEISNKRKCILYDVMPDYGSTITITIKGNEKGIEARNTTSNKIFKNSSLLDVASHVADKHGLTGVLEIPDSVITKTTLQLNPGENLTDFLIREHDYNTSQQEKRSPGTNQRILLEELKKAKERSQDPYFKGIDSIRTNILKAQEAGVPIDFEKEFERQSKFFQMSQYFKTYGNLPQANRTDTQLLNEVGQREKGGPYIAETRDDLLIIKKRNFNQLPYKTYTYGADDGIVLSFSPETKNRSRAGSSTNLSFNGWNPATKEFFSGDANPQNSGDPETTAQFLKMLKYYETQQKRGLGKAIIMYRDRVVRQEGPEERSLPKKDDRDNTRAVYNTKRIIPITVDNAVRAYRKALGIPDPDEKNYNKNFYNPLANDPASAFDQAANQQANNELKRNPAKLRVEMDPKLTSGIMITILGVGKKYSGNYYVTKADHSISGSAYATTELELIRHGHNLKPNDDYVSSKEIGRVPNIKIGDSAPEQKRQLSMEENPQ